jgi:nucleotide-binding universal stress UspA family protein
MLIAEYYQMTTLHQRIMVQIADPVWTEEALYRACILARKSQGEIVLVNMIPVQHLSFLGTSFGSMYVTEKERQAVKDYQATAEDYGVPYQEFPFQYFALADALVEVANLIEADVVFATLPQSGIRFWRRFQLNQMRHQLARKQRVLIECEDSAIPERKLVPPPGLNQLVATIKRRSH